MRRVACSITVRTSAWVPSSRSTLKKSQARIASAWERRNCAQVGPVRRGAGLMPLALRVSHTVDAATLTPRPASSPWILRYPVPLGNKVRHGDLQVFHASGGVGVFVDQAAQDGFSADLLSVDIGHRGAGSAGLVVGDALRDARCGRAVL